jgi:hypothetical protein
MFPKLVSIFGDSSTILVEKAEKTIWSHWPPSKSPRATFCQKEKDTFQATQAALFKRWKGKKCTFIFFIRASFSFSKLISGKRDFCVSSHAKE